MDKNFEFETKLVLLNFYKQTYHGRIYTQGLTEQRRLVSYSSDLQADCIDSNRIHTTSDDEDRFPDEIRDAMKNLQSENRDKNSAQSPIVDTAKSLREIADKFQEDYQRKIEQSICKLPADHLTYDNFYRILTSHLESAHYDDDLKRISTIMLFSGCFAHHFCNQGVHCINQVLDFTTDYLRNFAEDFIIGNGGWTNMAEIFSS